MDDPASLGPHLSMMDMSDMSRNFSHETAEKKHERTFMQRLRMPRKRDQREQNSRDVEDEDTSSEDSVKKYPKVSFIGLFRYATATEKVLMLIACICAFVHGAALPLFTIVFGQVITQFNANTLNDIAGLAKWFFLLGAGAAILAFFQVRLQLVAAQRIGARMRFKYFQSLMRQSAEWYDENEAGELVTRATDVQSIQAGIGEKLTLFLQYASMCLVGLIVAFAHSWKMTLVLLATTPLIGGAGMLMAKTTTAGTEEGLGAYGNAGAVANEALSMIRTVTAYGGQREEYDRYVKQLKRAFRAEVRKGIGAGFGFGLVMFVVFSVFGLGFWYGDRLIRSKEMETGTVFIVFFSVIIGASSLGQAGPSLTAFAVAQGAAPRVFAIIEQESDIDPLDLDNGKTPAVFNGNIVLKDVDFNYKTRVVEEGSTLDRPNVLSKLNLTIPAGSSQALVGPSGCGKSTIVRLIERFYDVTGGAILVDGEDIRDLNVRWLRSQIGYVSQMPTLFMMSIRDNIALGASTRVEIDEKTGKQVLKRMDVTDEEIIAVAKMANAHKFIEKLPEGYDTVLGERGAMLSGGQKQRICIARALVRDPKILILDESTASLDAQSERVVQEALDKASAGRTTITIAHRLSTVRNASTISVLREGEIVESGTHRELMSREDGAYKRLVELQNVEAAEEQLERDDNIVVPENTAKVHAAVSSVHSEGTMTHVEQQAQEDENAIPQKAVFSRAFGYNKNEWYIILFGLIGAALAGAAFPASSIVLSKVTVILGNAAKEDRVGFYALMFVVVGAVALVGNILQNGALGISGEKLTLKMRAASFKALLKQDMAFFDKPENAVGALTVNLASEASLVKGITGQTLGGVVLAISTIGTGVGIAFYGCWRIALSILAVMPCMVLGGVMEIKLMTGFDTDSEKEFAAAGATASEAVDNFDTVSALGVQDHFLAQYDGALQGPLTLGRKKALISSVAFGFSELSQFIVWGVAFWVGSVFVRNGQCTFEGMMMGITGLIFGAASLGNLAIFMPDVSAALVAARKVFHLLDSVPSIDPSSESGKKRSSVQGFVSADDAKFEYPRRPDVPVLRGLTLSVEPGKTLALVGESGCGKSTIVSLLERFYDVREGSISLDHSDVKENNVQNLRSHLGIVSQEPDLFNRSVRDNICYGLLHMEGTPITDEMVEEAAKAANAHNFISELPQGYDTIAGPRGNRLSGGQKQRVAIARSLIRKPKVLLLDEATSALDASAEKIVQEALDRASSDRTTIAIAHRLSTIKDADSIAVISRGKVVEQGTHDELLRRQGRYAELIRNQLSS